MVPVLSLWLPIVLSAVAVFLVSFILHMLLRYHHNDWSRLPAEDEIRDALHRHNIPPGNYMTPWGGGPEAMKDPAWLAKYERGPVATLTFMRSGKPSMTDELIQWFGYSLVVSIFAAYIAGRALSPGADYLEVFRFVTTTGFLGYSAALLQMSIWYKRAWNITIKSMIDGFIYATLTAGMMGWLWPA